MDIREIGWRSALKRAEAGDMNAARRVFGAIAAYHQAGQPVPAPLVAYIATRAASIAAGESADRAFRLIGSKRGRRSMSQSERLHKYMPSAIYSHGLEEDGFNAAFAIDETARLFLMSAREVERARAWYRGLEDPATNTSNKGGRTPRRRPKLPPPEDQTPPAQEEVGRLEQKKPTE